MAVFGRTTSDVVWFLHILGKIVVTRKYFRFFIKILSIKLSTNLYNSVPVLLNSTNVKKKVFRTNNKYG